MAHFLNDVREAYHTNSLEPRLVVKEVTAAITEVRVESGHVDRYATLAP